ncbi:MAG: ACT domain-containing protein [Caulobacterales bacterium]|uniref:ACT domain-containing protein n=1 Tax=Glycocaulis sp. TaxID=1969725 RepID=UPI003FA188DE
MTTRIDIDFLPAEGAVVRLIGLVERRGYELDGVNYAPSTGTHRLSMTVRPRPGLRRIETLKAQIARVYGVTSVHALASPTRLEAAS